LYIFILLGFEFVKLVWLLVIRCWGQISLCLWNWDQESWRTSLMVSSVHSKQSH